MINISSNKQGGAMVVQVNGRIDAVSAPEFEHVCLELVRGGETLIILDFGGVQYISSAGLRSVLIVGKALQERGGALRLANVTGVVGQAFELSGFYSLFPHFDSLERAAAQQIQTTGF